MSTVYVVRRGDTLTRIARDHGFDSWRTIYNHPDNAAFRRQRPNPDLIYPGDRIVIPDVVTAVTATGATRIPAFGNPDIIHFVTPKGAGAVTLTATVSPHATSMRSRITWEGASAGANNLTATVPKTSARKQVVRIKVGGRTEKELRVWVIWTNVTTSDVPISYSDPVNVGSGQTGAHITGGYRFIHRIQPVSVITDADRPNLRGANTTSPPGGNHPLFGDPLSGGVDRKWDSSRQIKAKVFNAGGITNSQFTQPPPVAVAAYPTNDVEGNDDRATGDENNRPYATGGVLRGYDSPGVGIAHAAASNGDTFEWRLHFREFARVELAGTWHRISNFFPWRIHLKFRKSAGKWVNNSTAKATNNSGF
ncbi:MAG: LysM peptidoglycan-binding domain-containing protein [Planctomycetota bacterium]|jgi:N-acetylmuramoyl-L-alanine amidase